MAAPEDVDCPESVKLVVVVGIGVVCGDVAVVGNSFIVSDDVVVVVVVVVV